MLKGAVPEGEVPASDVLLTEGYGEGPVDKGPDGLVGAVLRVVLLGPVPVGKV